MVTPAVSRWPSVRLPVAAAGRTVSRPPRIRTCTVAAQARHLPYLANHRALTCCAVSPQRSRPSMTFVFLASQLCRRLPSDRPSRPCPCLELVVDVQSLTRWFSYRGLSPHKHRRMPGVHMKLKLTKEPVTRLACATHAPEPLGSLTWCYVLRRSLQKPGRLEWWATAMTSTRDMLTSRTTTEYGKRRSNSLRTPRAVSSSESAARGTTSSDRSENAARRAS